MIECKTFFFKPTGNGVVNFVYEMRGQSQAADEAKAAVVADEKGEANPIDKKKKDLEGEQIGDRGQKQQEEQGHEQEREVILKSPNRNSSACIPTDNHRFIEEFCEGHPPPPEEDDDWSPPADPKSPVDPISGPPDSARLMQTLAELKRLGFTRRLGPDGKLQVFWTPEAQAYARTSPEYQWLLRLKSQNQLDSLGLDMSRVEAKRVSSSELVLIKAEAEAEAETGKKVKADGKEA